MFAIIETIPAFRTYKIPIRINKPPIMLGIKIFVQIHLKLIEK